ncbi:hypothetical protein [Bradyrhizobium jicamae]|uniref:hypothetical protein n=1 Tax=Bradyrhizobium jicamae TaxID=280332 RepID=UPI001BA66D13|nr:hypothetical protein [Bradyrhizobium jicamae]MBR0936685.1 hypothetical protein [Bradyrhizobium jicamae]
MNDRLEAFLAEIEAAPKFIDAVRASPAVQKYLDALEWGLNGLSLIDDPNAIEMIDAAVKVVDRKDMTLKERALAIVSLLSSHQPRTQ